MKEKRKGKLVFEIVVLCFVVTIGLLDLFGSVFNNPAHYFSSDISELYYPWHVFMNQKLHTLTLPIRNEYYLMGSPAFFARGDTAVLYPINWIFHIFKINNSLDLGLAVYFIQILFHYVLASVSFFLFLRRGLNLRMASAMTATLAYVLAGSYMSRLVHPPLQYSLAWFPALMLFYILFIRKINLLNFFGCVFSLCMLILSGHPQFVYYFVTAFIFSIAFFSLTEKRNKLKVLLLSFCILLVGFGICAAQIFPTAELSLHSQRTSAETTIGNLYNSLNPLYYLTLIIPKLYGKHMEGYWGSEYPWGNWENHLYVGEISIIAVSFSMWWKRKRELLWVYVSLCTLLILSFGKFSSLSSFINMHMPFNTSFSWVSRVVVPFHFFLSILIGVGVDFLFESKRLLSKHLLSFAFITGIGVFLLYLNLNTTFIDYLKPNNTPPPSVEAFKRSVGSLRRSSLYFLISYILIFLFLKTKKKFALVAIPLLLIFDVLPIGREFNPIDVSPGLPETFFRTNEAIEKIKADKSIFRAYGLAPVNSGMVHGIQTVGGYSTTAVDSYQKISPYLNPNYPQILKMSNVKYIISPDKPAGTEFNEIISSLWINDKTLPRVYSANGLVIVDSEENLISELTRPEFNPETEILIIKDDIPVELPAFSTSFGKIDEVSVNSHSSNKILLSTVSNNEGFLVLSELRYPGWKAKIDGNLAKLIPANLAFYALRVPAGKHQVEFFFDSPSVKSGVLTSLVSLGGFALFGLFAVFKKKR